MSFDLLVKNGTIATANTGLAVADLTIVDLDVEDTIEASRLHGKNNQTPFEGHRTRGAAVATVVRGQVVMQDGKLVGAPRGDVVQRH